MESNNGIKLVCAGFAVLVIGFSPNFFWLDSEALSSSVVVALVTGMLFPAAVLPAGDLFRVRPCTTHPMDMMEQTALANSMPQRIGPRSTAACTNR